MSDQTPERPQIFVHADFNPDGVRCFYEIPDALAQHIWGDEESRTFVECLAELANVEEVS